LTLDSRLPTPDSRPQAPDSLFRDLPDQNGARVFLQRLSQEQPRSYQSLTRDPGLLSDALALSSWSPLLATTLEQNPDYISWLSRERANPRVRTSEDLKESLARFALTNSSLNPQVLLARFRRRELLRTYLHDIRGTHTLVETTEELSNIADAVLEYALNLERQELDNRYGPPRRKDERGRIASAEFCIVALGKLGSLELNYASDIDLLFLYSDDGTTAGSQERGELTNREYFIKLAETIVKVVGQPAGEGAAYRVDLRLRPHGRDGALACSLDEAVRYYRTSAQRWELQALIRSRPSAGSGHLFSRFQSAVSNHVFREHVSVSEALASVRLAKQKIDRHVERSQGGYNVKLSPGGIREIEFIAQALQLAHGGRDEWLRVPHTLVSLGRLADRNLISEQERTELSDAYVFLRTLEHRLQMEHGLQTHVVPQPNQQRLLVAKRMNFKGEEALAQFESALRLHANNVKKAYKRVFADADLLGASPMSYSKTDNHGMRTAGSSSNHDAALARAAAAILLPHLSEGEPPLSVEALAGLLSRTADTSLNSHRALTLLSRIASSLEKTTDVINIGKDSLHVLVRLCGASEFFAEMIASNPSLILCLSSSSQILDRRDFRGTLRAAIEPHKTFAAELSSFRRQWSKLLLEIGVCELVEELSVFESNRLQTELAVASLNVACLIARRELARRYGKLAFGPRIAIFGLGRLGSGGVDYGSDLDIIVAYDSLCSSPLPAITADEAYARLVELMIAALSSITREGYLYRIDLRLRPNGKNGPLVSSSESFLDYVKGSADVWEWLAYVKLRAIAGDLEFGKMIETHSRHAIHERASKSERQQLQEETRRVRDRLEVERGRVGRHGGIDIKYAAGGMLDAYFATRYLQLASDLPDEGDDRSTHSTLDRLASTGALGREDYEALSDGYALLRSVDHHVRLLFGKSARLPATDHPALQDIARKAGFVSSAALEEALRDRMRGIREAYQRITEMPASA